MSKTKKPRPLSLTTEPIAHKPHQPSLISQRSQPSLTTQQPSRTTQQPSLTTQQPPPTVQEPPPTVQEPQPTAQEPPPTAQEPSLTTQQPSLTTQQPSLTTQQPPPTVQEPPPTAQEPPPTAQEPSLTTQQPSLTTQELPPTALSQLNPTATVLQEKLEYITMKEMLADLVDLLAGNAPVISQLNNHLFSSDLIPKAVHVTVETTGLTPYDRTNKIFSSVLATLECHSNPNSVFSSLITSLQKAGLNNMAFKVMENLSKIYNIYQINFTYNFIDNRNERWSR